MSHSKHKLPICSNCGFKFEGVDNFCPQCGQKNEEIMIPLKHHVYELFEGLFHLDSKSFRTITKLIFSPGALSLDFNNGKRASSVPPLRLYIFISFIFFLILSMKSFNTEQNSELNLSLKFATTDIQINDSESKNLNAEQVDSLKRFRSEISIKELRGLSDSQIDSLTIRKGLSQNWLNKYIVHKLTQVARGEEEKFWHSILKNISYSMFLLMPLVALFIMFFYRKQTKYFVESLVLSIHYHIFIFILLSGIMLLSKFFAGISWILILTSIIGISVYLFLMLKKYFRQGRIKTAIKVLLLELIHIILIVILYVGTIIVSMVLL
jgi:hypothetical protein